MNHIPPCLFLSRGDEDDIRDIGKHDFRAVLLYPMLSNANRERNEAGYPERVGNRNCLTSVCGL